VGTGLQQHLGFARPVSPCSVPRVSDEPRQTAAALVLEVVVDKWSDLHAELAALPTP